MADILSIFGLLLIMALGFPALLTAVWLLFPGAVDRAHQRVEQTPVRCFVMGLLALLVVGLPVLALLDAPSAGLKAAGFGLIVLSLSLGTVGAAGLVARLSQRLNQRSGRPMRPLAGFLTAGATLELAVAFPVIGWLLVLPIALLTALGATVFALLRWRPKAKPQPAATLSPTGAPS